MTCLLTVDIEEKKKRIDVDCDRSPRERAFISGEKMREKIPLLASHPSLFLGTMPHARVSCFARAESSLVSRIYLSCARYTTSYFFCSLDLYVKK